MSSKLSKQAQLRQLMTLAREKKERLKHAEREATPKGILKKTAAIVAATTTTNTTTTQPPKDDEPGALSALMGGYDSDDSSEQANTDEPDETTKPQQGGSEKRGIQWAEDSKGEVAVAVSEFSVVPEDPPTVHVAPSQETASVGFIDQENAMEKTDDIGGEVEEQVESAMDPKVWAEFQDLVNGDETTAKATEVKSKKKKKKKRKGELMTEARDTTEVEQASYEARLAKLMLRAMDRKARKKQKSGTDCNVVEPVVVDYAPSLAFASDNQDDNGSSIEPKDTSELDDNGTEQGQSLDEMKMAPISHLAILRQKRARARKMAGMDFDADSDEANTMR
mmetsp:Transcript_23293/g.42037  ORF Transcript_23293/g.42037 Transcript_23293/m.42037 type:complete len:336 (-) Transcript_23293:31-1038(-)